MCLVNIALGNKYISFKKKVPSYLDTAQWYLLDTIIQPLEYLKDQQGLKKITAAQSDTL